MPRTSYGDEKREQAWKIIDALFQKKAETDTGRVILQDLTISYKDWELQTAPSMEVRGTLSALRSLCGENFSVEQVRESLNEHLSNKFLSVLQDYRKAKAGRGADQWHFRIFLWSVDREENREEFNDLWRQKRDGKAKDPEILRGRLQDVVGKSGVSFENGVFISKLNSVMSPYEKLVQDFVDASNSRFGELNIKSISESDLKIEFLSIIQKVSRVDAVLLYKFSGKNWVPKESDWVPKEGIGEDVAFYSQIVSSGISEALQKTAIFGKDSHGFIVNFEDKIFSIIPLEKTGSLSTTELSILILCNLDNDSIFRDDPSGRIVSALYSVSKESLCKSIDSVESAILDALKTSFRFVSPKFYERRYEIFCQRLYKMTVHFQPIVRLKPLVLEAWEALARDPMTMCAPVDLFAAAELWGVKFITELDLYFLKKSVQLYHDARVLLKLKRLDETLPLAINVYPDSLMREKYLDTVQEIIESGILYSGKLILEISEKSALPQTLHWNDDRPTWSEFGERLKEYARRHTGVRFAIDDFGVGYASVSRLVGLRIDYVKIDQEVLRYESEVRDSVIKFVRDTLIESGRAPHIVLEGVDENYPLKDILSSEVRAQSIQGFLVGKASDRIYDRLNDLQLSALRKQTV
jgi:EAL domain-containing protein (putative c-di-GMP-specific phosphodiesterase class I)